MHTRIPENQKHFLCGAQSIYTQRKVRYGSSGVANLIHFKDIFVLVSTKRGNDSATSPSKQKRKQTPHLPPVLVARARPREQKTKARRQKKLQQVTMVEQARIARSLDWGGGEQKEEKSKGKRRSLGLNGPSFNRNSPVVFGCVCVRALVCDPSHVRVYVSKQWRSSRSRWVSLQHTGNRYAKKDLLMFKYVDVNNELSGTSLLHPI